MIDLSKLNTSFTQNGGSCVLSSYAIVGNYFTSIPIEKYFEDYCKHFGRSFQTWREAEQIYAAHFDSEWRSRRCKGYEVILDLHNNSKEKAFIQSRQIFCGKFYDDSAQFASHFDNELLTEEAFLNITYEPGRNYHSITSFYDNNKRLLARDTNTTRLTEIGNLLHIGKLRDSVLYKRTT